MKEKLKINILGKTGLEGGIYIFLKTFLKEAKKNKDFDFNIFMISKNKKQEEFYKDIKISKVKGFKFLKLEFINPFSFIKKNKSQILHVHNYTISTLPSILFSGYTNVITVHSAMKTDIPYSGKFKILKKTIDKVFNFILINLMPLIFEKIVFITNHQKETFIKRSIFKNKLRKKSSVIYNFIEKEKIKKEKKKPQNSINLLFVGRLLKSKGFYDLIELIKDEELKDINFTIVGQGPGEEELKKLKTQKNLNFLGKVPNDKIQDIYDKNNVLILPSYSETFGLVILEAMSRGLAVLATDLLEIKEYFKQGKNGFLFPKKDIKKIKELLIKLKNKPELIEEISQNNLKYIKDFSSDLKVNEYLNIYKQVLENKNERKTSKKYKNSQRDNN